MQTKMQNVLAGEENQYNQDKYSNQGYVVYLRSDSVKMMNEMNRKYKGIKVYSDICSGISNPFKRPGMIDLLNDVRNGKVEKVITQNISRISRGYNEAMKVIKVLGENNVDVMYEI